MTEQVWIIIFINVIGVAFSAGSSYATLRSVKERLRSSEQDLRELSIVISRLHDKVNVLETEHKLFHIESSLISRTPCNEGRKD